MQTEVIMFCKYCGNEIQQGSAFCRYCGNATEKPAQSADPFDTPPTSYTSTPNTAPESVSAPLPKTNGMATAGFALSFFIPIVGLICSILGLKKSNECDGTGKGLAIAGIVISVLGMVFNAIVSISIMPYFMAIWRDIIGGIINDGYNVLFSII